MIELGELIHILPDLPVGGMKNVCSVFMHVNSAHIACIDVPGNGAAPVKDKTGLSRLFHLM